VPEGGLARGACGLVAVCAGQSGVVENVLGVAAPRLHRHLLSTSNLGLNCSISSIQYVCQCDFMCILVLYGNHFTTFTVIQQVFPAWAISLI